MQTPQYGLDTLPALKNLPLTGAATENSGQILSGVASILAPSATKSYDYDVQPMVEIFATTQGRDLGGVSADIRQIVAVNAHRFAEGRGVVLRGQVQTMNSAFSGLLFGLLGAVVLIYLLIVINFQSWTDPLVIVSALPARWPASCGCVRDTHHAVGSRVDRRHHVHGCRHRKQRARHQLRARAA